MINLNEISDHFYSKGFDIFGAFDWTPESFEKLDWVEVTDIPDDLSYIKRESKTQPWKWWSKPGKAFLLGKSYKKPELGGIARYATGQDYHKVVTELVRSSCDELKQKIDGSFDYKISVDTSPIRERTLAQLSGEIWIGKNGLALHKKHGSFHFLSIVATTIEVHSYPSLNQFHLDYCGSCTRCIDACPTQALTGDSKNSMILDRCISFWNNEYKGEKFPEGVKLNQWVVGCDICQNVCPWNLKPQDTQEPSFQPDQVDFWVHEHWKDGGIDLEKSWDGIKSPLKNKAYGRLKDRLKRNLKQASR